MSRKKIIISLIIGGIISVIGFYFAMRNVPLSDLLAYVESINYWWMIPPVLLSLFTFVLRAFRWQLILSTSAKLPFFDAFHPMMIAFMANTILPGRVGELARPTIIKKRDNIPFSLGLSTVAAERMFDIISLIALFAWVLSTVHIDPNLQIKFKSYQLNKQTLDHLAASLMHICIAVIIAIVLISVPAVQRLAKAVIMKLPELLFFAGELRKDRVRERICIPLVQIVDHVASGLSMIKYPTKIILCLFYSFTIWLLQALALFLLAKGCPGIDLTFTQMTTVFVLLCFFIALPSVPGFWGVWEAGGVFGLALFGISAKNAAGLALASHAVLMFPVMIAGFISAVIIGVNVLNISYSEIPDTKP